MPQSCLKPTKITIIFTVDISKHARHTELEDHQENMLSYLFSQSHGVFLPFHCLSSIPHFLSVLFPPNMFHLTIQRKTLESKEVSCFHSESWESFFVGFFSNS